MADSAINICRRALLSLGARPITAFDEGTMEAELADEMYPNVRDNVLAAHPWRFARIETRLAYDNLYKSISEKPYQFHLPDDCMRVLEIGTPQGTKLPYRVGQGNVYAEHGDIVVAYVGRPSPTSWPPFFDPAVVTALAAALCLPLTERPQRARLHDERARTAMAEARAIDSQQSPPIQITEFPLVHARLA